jgi:sugar phosphate isomerase/epimerase
MTTSRRNFIRNSALVSAGMLVYGKTASGSSPQAGNLLKEIGVCTSVKNSALFAGAGFSYIEETVRGFLVPQSDEKAFEENLALAKISKLPVTACNSFLPGDLKSTGADAVHDEILKYSETAFRRAKKVGINIIVFGSGGSREIPGGFSRTKAEDQFVELGKRMADIAGKYGVVVVVEPLNKKECNFINSVAEGGELVKRIDHPNVRLLADIYHMLVEDEGPESLVEYGDLLRHIHIAEKEGRTPPGVHGEDFIPYFKALKKAGYKGRMSVECRWKNQTLEAPAALTTLRDQIKKV